MNLLFVFKFDFFSFYLVQVAINAFFSLRVLLLYHLFIGILLYYMNLFQFSMCIGEFLYTIGISFSIECDLRFHLLICLVHYSFDLTFSSTLHLVFLSSPHPVQILFTSVSSLFWIVFTFLSPFP